VQNSAQSISDWMKGTFALRYDVPAWAIYGVLLLILMYVLPAGIAGGFARVRAMWTMRGRREAR
jgi:branched-chain amino acid transport system permease protein